VATTILFQRTWLILELEVSILDVGGTATVLDQTFYLAT